jgi:hypothetical protein
VKTAGEILRDVILLGVIALLAWLFPKTMLVIEGVCGLGTLALFLFERHIA